MKTIATISTAKGTRYMKALVNHFSRKVDATYEGNQGSIAFGFGRCDIKAQNDALIFIAQSDTPANCTKVEGVIDSHLTRFMQDESVTLNWVAAEKEQSV